MIAEALSTFGVFDIDCWGIWIDEYTALIAFSVSALVDDGDWVDVTIEDDDGGILSVSIGIICDGSTDFDGRFSSLSVTDGIADSIVSSFTGVFAHWEGFSIGSGLICDVDSSVLFRKRFASFSRIGDNVEEDSVVERRLVFIEIAADCSLDSKGVDFSGRMNTSKTFSSGFDGGIGLEVVLICWRLFEDVTCLEIRFPLPAVLFAERDWTGFVPSRRLEPIKSPDGQKKQIWNDILNEN
jgi:hypothetical protein